MKIKVEKFDSLEAFEEKLNEVCTKHGGVLVQNIIATHVIPSDDRDGWGAVLIYLSWEDDDSAG